LRTASKTASVKIGDLPDKRKESYLSQLDLFDEKRKLAIFWNIKFFHFSAFWPAFDAKVFLFELNGQWGEGELRGPLVLLIHYCKDGGGGGEGGEGGRGS
jgi:hypothetical protein